MPFSSKLQSQILAIRIHKHTHTHTYPQPHTQILQQQNSKLAKQQHHQHHHQTQSHSVSIRHPLASRPSLSLSRPSATPARTQSSNNPVLRTRNVCTQLKTFAESVSFVSACVRVAHMRVPSPPAIHVCMCSKLRHHADASRGLSERSNPARPARSGKPCVSRGRAHFRIDVYCSVGVWRATRSAYTISVSRLRSRSAGARRRRRRQQPERSGRRDTANAQKEYCALCAQNARTNAGKRDVRASVCVCVRFFRKYHNLL